MQCSVRVCQERQCGRDSKLLVHLPDRASQEQPAHSSLYEPSREGIQVCSVSVSCSPVSPIHPGSQYISLYSFFLSHVL